MATEQRMPFPGVPPKDHGPSQKDIDAANAGKLAPTGIERAIQRLAKSKATYATLATGTATAAVYSYVTNPNFQQTIDSAYHNLLQTLGRETVVPPTFDNKLNKGSIGDNNIQLVSQDEAKKTNLQPVESDTSLTFLFPFQLPKGTQVTYEKTLSEAIPQDARTEGAQKGVKDNMDFVFPKDTLTLAPIDGHILAVGGQKTPENQNPSEWTRLFYYDGNKDMTYVLWFIALDDSSGHNAFNSLVPTQENKPSAWIGANWEQLPKVQQKTPLLTTIKENQAIRLNVRAYKGKIVGPQAEVTDKTFSVVTPQFLTTQAPESSKLLVLGK